MIAVMIPSAAFTLTSADDKFQLDCREFCSRFPEDETTIEFFYYLKSTDPNRYFIIRVQPAQVGDFVPAVEQFAERRSFEILSSQQSRPILNRIDLNSFV